MKENKYIAKQADAKGYVSYTKDEHEVWHDLFTQQMDLLANRACPKYLQGIEAWG